MYDTILVGTDNSEKARTALAHAIDLADEVGATVHVATVLDDSRNPMQFGVEEAEALDEAARDLLADIEAAYDNRDVPLETEIRRGEPAPVLLDYARDIDAGLLVVGQQGAGGVAGQLLGSTADRLAESADRPLLLVPADAPPTVSSAE